MYCLYFQACNFSGGEILMQMALVACTAEVYSLDSELQPLHDTSYSILHYPRLVTLVGTNPHPIKSLFCKDPRSRAAVLRRGKGRI